MHQKWKTDYKKLERDHGYIQWFVGLTAKRSDTYGVLGQLESQNIN